MKALAATIAPDQDIANGSPLPPEWHWPVFNPFVPMCEVGDEGHPRKGDFLPSVALTRRMWAGGEIAFIEHLRAGEKTTRDFEIASIEEKSGKQGHLVFVTVRHCVEQGTRVAIDELQNIVYRNPVTAAPTAAGRRG